MNYNLASSSPTQLPYNPQLQSPLFGIVPAEIRNAIFDLALQEYEDPAQPYEFESYHYRPGYRCRHRLDTALLRTCRRIYLETRSIPLQNATETFWMAWDERIPPERRSTVGDPSHRLSKLSIRNRKQLGHVQLFVQMVELEFFNLRAFLMNNRFAPKKITITIRYTDWWYWEDDAEPFFKRGCLIPKLEAPASVEEFVIQFETLEKKKAQMQDLFRTEKILEQPIRREDGIEMRTEGCQLRSETWTGTAMFDGRKYEHHGEGKTIEYCVIAATWRPCRKSSGEASSQGIYRRWIHPVASVQVASASPQQL